MIHNKRLKTKRPKLIVMPGDGVGKEVVREAVRVLEWFAKHRGFDCDLQHEEFGAEYYQKTGKLMRDEARLDLLSADAVLFGAIGGTIDDFVVAHDVRLREGLLGVRRAMGLFANLRPVKVRATAAGASPLRPEISRNVDLLVLRELIGGIYFGEPRGVEDLPDGQRRGFNTEVYSTNEITRIGEMAFQLARGRRGHVTSIDKANVMESAKLWREEMSKLHASKHADVGLGHMYVDNCVMQMVLNPRQFDVLVASNIFGDILSDCAAGVVGSLGLAPSASLSEPDAEGHRRAFYEPVHGSAPDIAGKSIANPIAAILSFGMALEYSFDRLSDSRLLDRAVDAALGGARTADLREAGIPTVSTAGMADAIMAGLDRLADEPVTSPSEV